MHLSVSRVLQSVSNATVNSGFKSPIVNQQFPSATCVEISYVCNTIRFQRRAFKSSWIPIRLFNPITRRALFHCLPGISPPLPFPSLSLWVGVASRAPSQAAPSVVCWFRRHHGLPAAHLDERSSRSGFRPGRSTPQAFYCANARVDCSPSTLSTTLQPGTLRSTPNWKLERAGGFKGC